MTRLAVALGATTLMLASLALPAAPAAAQRLVDVRQLPSDTLRDVAAATVDGGRPVIWVNPARFEQLAPWLRAFVLAHEYGHIALGHHPEPGDASTIEARRQRQELTADCYALDWMLREQPAAVPQVIAFFRTLGPARADRFHPSGSQRAANLLACLPSSQDAELAALPASN